MKKTIVSLLALIVLIGLGTTPASAAVPTTAVQNTPGLINYQGILATPGGQQSFYADGTYTFDIRLYRTISGSNPAPVWGGTYTTYVRNGYFNIMLGGDTGSFLAGTTYPHNELWKALWPDPNTPENQKNTLFLGITPHQDVGGYPIANPVELAPRQNLLAAPYAFRAQTAEYANQSISNFVANGTLSADFLSVGGGMNLGNYPVLFTYKPGGVKTVIVGNDIFSAAAHVIARDVDISAGLGDMNLKSTSGITLKTEGTAGSTVAIEAKTLASLKGLTGATVDGTTGNVSLKGAKIQGQNTLEWNRPSASGTYSKPFQVIRQDLTMQDSDGAYFTTTYSYMDWSAMIVGVNCAVDTSPAGEGIKNFRMINSGGFWRIALNRDTPVVGTRTYNVDVLFINKNLVSDPQR